MLAAVFDPLHRPSQPAREEGDQQVFRVNMPLQPEASADVERDAAHARLGQAQHRGRLAAHPMHDLGRRPDRHRIRARVVRADDAAAFHGRGRIAMMIKAPLQPVRRARERGFDVALADGEGADQVGVESVVHDRGFRAQCLLRVDDGGERIEIETDQLRGILGRVPALGHDDGDGLADVADLVMREKRLLRIDEFVLDQRRPFARQRKLRVRHRRQERQEVGAGQGTDDAGCGKRLRQMHAADARVGNRASDEDRVQHVRQIEIGDELSAAGQQSTILAARQRAADERGS